MIPSAQRALTDPRIRGTPREIYFWLHERLDVVEYRALSFGQITQGTGIRRGTVFKAVRVLVDTGYLDTRLAAAHRTLFRLVHAPK